MSPGHGTPLPPPVLLAQALTAFLLLSLPAYGFWALAQDRGWVDLHDRQGAREVGTAIFGACGLLVLSFATVVRPPVPWRPARVGAVLAAYLPFLVGWAALLVAYLRLAGVLGYPVAPQDLLLYGAEADPRHAGFWLVVAVVVLLGPLAEEVVFRGYVQGALERIVGQRTGLWAAAAVFGLVHGLPYALPVGVLGLFFGWLRQRHGGLMAPFAAHAVHNGIVLGVTWAWPRSLDLLYPR
jgi:membrane protease YdiL (CAAX protease family)